VSSSEAHTVRGVDLGALTLLAGLGL